MEGELLKWTNYVSGWQPRWFVLNDDGTLSYFNSRDDMRNGCRGSVNLALCNIIVHQYDPKRLDIVIPGEQHYSLKAPTANDRSAWLRLLGSSKLAGKRKTSENDVTDMLKARRSEVRLYMDLILQQASEAQLALARDEDKAAAQNSLAMLVTTVQVLSRSVDECLLLSSTCYNFTAPNEAHIVVSPSSTPTPAKFLDSMSVNETTPEVNVVSNGEKNASASPPNYFNSQLGLIHCKTPQTPNSPSSCDKLSIDENFVCSETPVLRDANKLSVDSLDPHSLEVHLITKRASETPVMPSGTVAKAPHPPQPTALINVAENIPTNGTTVVMVEPTNGLIPVLTPYVYKSTLRELESTFSDVEIEISTGDMQVVSFLNASRSILVILDRLRTSVLSPVRGDVSGNITKIETTLKLYEAKKIVTLKCTIQKLIRIEIENGKSTSDPSASIGLVWLVRGLEFVALFLRLLAEPDCTDARTAASEAYNRSLRKFHGLMARTVFSLAMQALPGRPTQFLASIGGDGDVADIQEDLSHYCAGLREVLDALGKFLDKAGISKKL